MNQSSKDRWFTVGILASYFLTWLLVLSAGFKLSLLLPALLLAGVYAAGHGYEMQVRGHLALSADATAIPTVLIVTLLGAGLAYGFGVPVREIVNFTPSIGVAWLLGHLVIFAGCSFWTNSAWDEGLSDRTHDGSSA